MDKCSSDAEFDSYWDYEAKNKNRNRIRVGRQYQAIVPPLLKPGEKDERRCEELETLKWKPDQLSEEEVDQYLSMAKGIGLFAKAVDNSKTSENSDKSLQSAIKGLSEFVASHHPCHHDDGCQVPKPSSSGESSSKNNLTNDWSPSEAQLFAQALEACGKNFCAIKKEYLPWKPVKSIIEFYYQGKGEKSPEPGDYSGSLETPKKDQDEPFICSSQEEKPFVTKVEPSEDPPPETLNSEPEKESDIFLENSRVTDHCQDPPEFKMSVNDDESTGVSSTVGSLRFFLGGRLVLKLNAKQDSGSGTKCQWVQSNDLPKHSNPAKKVKHKKKSMQGGSSVFTPENPLKAKKSDELSTVSNSLSDCELLTKKPKLKSEYDFLEADKQELLLCSSSWTPPIADGQESVEMDDGSSKSEGYVSPVLSRSSKGDVRNDFSNNLNSVNELGEQKCDSDSCLAKFESRGGNAQTENCFLEDSASENVCIVGRENSPCQFSDDTFLKQEVLNHKSALSHNKSCVKSPCYQPRISHSNSPLLKQWSKWSNFSYPVKTSPSSLSPASLVDSKSPVKDIPLDLSSKFEIIHNVSDQYDEPSAYEANIKVEYQDKCMPSEIESRPASSEYSSQSSNQGLQMQNTESPEKDVKKNLYKCSEDINDDQQFMDTVKNENSDYSPNKSSGDTSQLPYTYCNLPYHCALPKCTKEYSLEEHLCNKSHPEKKQESSTGYIIHDVDESICKKTPAWCSASYLQFYPQCYPYYVTYGIAPSPVSESTVTEVPLDLSSSSENIKEKSTVPETLSEDINDVTQKNTEAVERGMLYQLLKNKTSK